MAARYWVGGTGNWSDATNHWSDSSGGAPGAGFLPTSGDDVYFDNLSAASDFTLTLDSDGICADFSTASLTTRLCTFVNASNNKILNIYGSFFVTPYIRGNWAGYGSIKFRSTGAEVLDITATNWLIPTIYFDGIGGSWVCQQNFSLIGCSIQLTNGELNINDKTIRVNTFSTVAGTKTLTLGTGKLILYYWYNNVPAGFTFNYNTGTVEMLCFNSIVAGVTTFYNLNITSEENVTWKICEIYSDITILNQLTINGVSNNYRILVRGNPMGTRRTITAENLSVQYADFSDIIGAGNANWDLSNIAGGIGDALNNVGITFPASKTSYYYGTGGNWTDLSKWFSQTNGGGTSNYYPLCHDNIIFDSNSLLGVTNINYDTTSTCNDFDCSDIVYILNISTGTTNNRRFMVWGSMYLNVLLAFTGTNSSIYFFGRTTTYLDSNGVNMKGVNLCNYNAIMLLLSNVYSSMALAFLANTNCGLDLNNYNITFTLLQFFGKVFYLRSGTLTFTTVSNYALYIGSNGIQPGTSTIILNPASGNANILNYLTAGQIGSPSYLNNLTIAGNHSGNFDFIYTNTNGLMHLNVLQIEKGRKIRFSAYGNTKMIGLIANGTASEPITITSNSAAQHKLFNLSTTDFVVNYCNISYSNVTGTPKIKTLMDKAWTSINKAAGIAKASIKKVMGISVNSAWIANNSTDSGNNSGWTFNP